MRVLVLVLSSARSPWMEIQVAQKRTWESEDVPDAPVMHYFADEPQAMTGQLRQALRLALAGRWDFVFRTNSSSYVDRWRILVHAKWLPAAECYQGIDGDGFASGSGFFLSRDAAAILANDLPWRSEVLADDVAVGQVLVSHGIFVTPGAERIDYWYERMKVDIGHETEIGFRERLVSAYHVRCKGEPRERDIEAMDVVHKMKMEARACSRT